MKWLDAARWLTLLLIATAEAQQLYKYTDKDGKVTYSDRAPKEGEKAELVGIDAKANIMPGKTGASPAGKPGIVARPSPGLAKLVDKREKGRDKLQAEVDAAQKNLDAAKAALEGGRDPKPSEQQIVVRQGGNSVIQKPEYAERVAALEQAVKNAEEKLAKAEEKYRRNAPD